MSLILSEIPTGGKAKVDYGRLEDGTYFARIISVIDCGTQPQTDWQTKEPTDPKHIVMITFETPDETIEVEDKDGNKVTKPRWISKEYLLSMSEMAALYKLRMSLLPKMKSLDELLNVPCMVNIGSTSGNKAKITGVSKPIKGVEVGDLSTDSFYFDFDHPNMELFNGLLKWQQEKIKGALDYTGFADDAPDTGTSAGTDEY